jgi:alanyl-tRNA synthetase
MTANELREAFLTFFESRGHVRRPSDSLVPTNDPTLLFTGAGMNQFKEYFLGRGEIPFRRATTAQKCLRTGDVDNVGRTASHLTFFEMLGNFSFGDYFKKEAITWAWELSTQVFRMDPARIRVSVYEKDDEAWDIWRNLVGIRPDWIHRFGAKDNFWPANAPTDGPNGPCGPCSELFYDQGEGVGCGRPACDPSCSCDRYVEFYNLVFTQFDRQPDGALLPLPQKNIDTGLGFDRLVAVLAGAPNNFETELFLPYIKRIEEMSKRRYATTTDDGRRMRRISDHVRAVTFCIADGVLPSNEGRGYVVRRLLRTASIDGRGLGIDDPFLYQLVPVVGAVMGEPYPEVVERRETIARMVKAEEEKFLQTLAAGENLIEELEAEYRKSGKPYLSGKDLFRLFDTYGLPPEVVALRLKVTDETMKEFEAEMEKQRETARDASKMKGEVFVTGALGEIRKSVPGTEFVGYETTSAKAKVLAIIREDRLVDSAQAGERLTLVLDRTPFYGEQGGQVGDAGTLRSASAEFDVTDTKLSPPHTLHAGVLTKGTLKVGDEVEANVDAARRRDIRRNHSATHLLHAALRQILGEHAEQSGSYVGPDGFRFDFHHFEAPKKQELEKVERLVNEKIMENIPVTVEEMDIEAARATGAKALFGEKYGDTVRVVRAGDFSKELCGGTHCERSGDIGQFKIIGEESVAAGIRRITGITGRFALDYWKEVETRLHEVADELKSPVAEVVKRVQTINKELKELRKEQQKARAGELTGQIRDLVKQAPSAGGVKVVIARIDGLTANDLRSAVDVLKRSGEEVAAALASAGEGKVALVVYAGPKAQKAGVSAGDVVKQAAAVVKGGGGGRPDMAQAGGTDVAKTNDALDLARKLLLEKLGPS